MSVTVFKLVINSLSRRRNLNMFSLAAFSTNGLIDKIQKASYGGQIYINHGLPFIDIPLPSRKENCHFILRPFGDTVGSLSEALSNEDSGIEVVAFYTSEGLRISKCTRVQHLLIFPTFYLRINDSFYKFDVDTSFYISSLDKAESFNDIRSKISTLYTLFDVEEYKIKRENALQVNLENIERKLRPLLIIRKNIEAECEKFARRIFWAGFSVICFQVGVFSRLTWWEYSWDIMEPITYFSTFSSVVIALAYYLVTKQNFEYSSANFRIFNKDFYRRARKYSFDVAHFNELIRLKNNLNNRLQRIRSSESLDF
ncbi:MCU domain-containing protein [Meloidogyne graminicola]|uniref:Calcium uniporter protein n=1 Tax=Meloidogyne graminicola TaxID=189291 RepID=A0A8S9ZVK5_9BILA|nr:MCU domain-containing protein [Meloidogyne graminicola]